MYMIRQVKNTATSHILRDEFLADPVEKIRLVGDTLCLMLRAIRMNSKVVGYKRWTKSELPYGHMCKTCLTIKDSNDRLPR